MSFHVGQKVECLRDDWTLQSELTAWPVAGKVYTIREIAPGLNNPARIWLRLHEIVNAPRQWASGFYECAFAATDRNGRPRFRPITEREADISVFTKLLTPSQPKQPVTSRP